MRFSMVVPVFNEVESIPKFLESLGDLMSQWREEVEVVFVDDGSTDGSSELLESISLEQVDVVVVRLSRNFGKEAALMAGFRATTGDAVVPVDVDLQDPLSLMPNLAKAHLAGFDVVNARSSTRSPGSFVANAYSRIFHNVFSYLTADKSVEYLGDFRLMSREVVDVITSQQDSKIYMKGLMSWAGFTTTTIDYVREQRVQGKSKISFSRRVSLALDAILGWTSAPSRLFLGLGISASLIALGLAFFVAVQTIYEGSAIPGIPTLIVSVLLLGGLNLVGISMLGEYMWRILIESKRRPPYVVIKTLKNKKSTGHRTKRS